jgi:5-formyltetrahydrofolate cyclo-ligase
VNEKQRVREFVWDRLQHAGAARFPGARGRIPNFTGAEHAARLLSGTAEWERAGVVKSNPDAPQLPVRAAALAAGKLLFMAVPRLREREPFIMLDPDSLPVRPRQAVSIGGSSRHGRPVGLSEMPKLDLIVCGSVAVNRAGVRIGKGGGYSDLELALLGQAGLVDARTTIATTVHPLQVLDRHLPETEHDFRVDLIVMPHEVIQTGTAARRHRPRGVLWDRLTDEQIDAIPVLAELRGQRDRTVSSSP